MNIADRMWPRHEMRWDAVGALGCVLCAVHYDSTALRANNVWRTFGWCRWVSWPEVLCHDRCELSASSGLDWDQLSVIKADVGPWLALVRRRTINMTQILGDPEVLRWLCPDPSLTSCCAEGVKVPLWGLESHPKSRRGILRRAVFSEEQRKELERTFRRQKYISKTDRHRLAADLCLKETQVGRHAGACVYNRWLQMYIL